MRSRLAHASRTSTFSLSMDAAASRHSDASSCRPSLSMAAPHSAQRALHSVLHEVSAPAASSRYCAASTYRPSLSHTPAMPSLTLAVPAPLPSASLYASSASVCLPILTSVSAKLSRASTLLPSIDTAVSKHRAASS